MYLPSGDDDPRLAAIETRLDRLLAHQEEEAKHRKIMLYVGVASAVIALGRLGILAVPFVKERRP